MTHSVLAISCSLPSIRFCFIVQLFGLCILRLSWFCYWIELNVDQSKGVERNLSSCVGCKSKWNSSLLRGFHHRSIFGIAYEIYATMAESFFFSAALLPYCMRPSESVCVWFVYIGDSCVYTKIALILNIRLCLCLSAKCFNIVDWLTASIAG